MDKAEPNQLPFHKLGDKLRTMREKAKESLADVSGAVEIDVQKLTDIETGSERPSEDILLLLMSHFNVKEDEAVQLFEMAGYEDRLKERTSSLMNDENGQTQPAVMVLPIDARVVYSDMVHVMVNNYGVIMNFMQGSGPNNQPLAIARIGMSKEHAESVLEVLQKTLEQHYSAEAAQQKPKRRRSAPQPSKAKSASRKTTSRVKKPKAKKSEDTTPRPSTDQQNDQ